MSRPEHDWPLGALDVDGDEIARVVVKGRPEVVACLDGLVFHGREDAMVPLLRAALINLTSGILLDLEDEDSLSACITDLMSRADRMPLAVKALRWEIQTLSGSDSEPRVRSAGYRAEIHDLLHQRPVALLKLDPGERDLLQRKAEESLDREGQRQVRGAEARIQELQTLLGDVSAEANSLLLTSLAPGALAEWVERWSEEESEAAQAQRAPASVPVDSSLVEGPAKSDLTLLRDIQMRLLGGRQRESLGSTCRPIIR
jgi:hypothetical protein